MFACSRKERQLSRAGTPYLTVELRDRTGSILARAFRDADLLAGRFERGDLVRVEGRVERFRDQLQIGLRAIARAEGAESDPAGFLPVAHRDLDELEGFFEHLARELYEPGLRALLEGVLGDARAAPRAAPGALLATHGHTPRWLRAGRGGQSPRLPWRPAGAHRRGRRAGAGAVHAAPAPGPRPAAGGGAPARHRQDPRVHLRRRDRPQRGGAAAGARRARPAPARAALPRLAAGASPPGARALHPRPPRPRGAARPALRLLRGDRPVPLQRARRPPEERLRARAVVGRGLGQRPHASPTRWAPVVHPPQARSRDKHGQGAPR